MVDMLPKLFFVHFRDTSFVAERNGELSGFLVGFLSQSEPTRPTSTSSGSARPSAAPAWAASSTSGSSTGRAQRAGRA